MIPENTPLAELQALFEKDRFATNAGCTIVEASREKVVCTMPISPDHLNAQGGVMGGAIFTLADFAFAVASNLGQPGTVSIENGIRFLSGAKGDTLIATALPRKQGRSLCFTTIEVKDNLGNPVATMEATGFRTER